MATPEEIQAYFSEVAHIRWEIVYGSFPPVAQRIEGLRRFFQRILRYEIHPLSGAVWRWDHHYLSVRENARAYDLVTNEEVRALVAELAEAKGHHGQGRSMPPEETADQAIRSRKSTVAAERFFVSAKQLADRVASTVRTYFGWKFSGGSAHNKLTEHFKKGCASLGIPTPDGLYAKIREVNKRIVRFRNEALEHYASPDHGIGGGMFWSPRSDGTYSVRIMIQDEEGPSTTSFAEDPQDLVRLIDEYMSALMDFIEQNVDKSTIRPSALT